MWKSLLRFFGVSRGTDSIRDQYDPVYGLPRRAVEDWLARNPQIREEYEAVLRARVRPAESGAVVPDERYRAVRHDLGREARLRPEPVEEGGGEAQGEQEPAHVRDRRQDRPRRQGGV